MKNTRFPLVFPLLGAVLVVFILLPLGVTLLSSPPRQVAEALLAAEVRQTIARTLSAAGIATAIGLLGGLPLAYLLARARFPGKRIVEGVIDLPVIIPHTAAGIALLMVFGRQGLLGKPLSQFGLIFTDTLTGIVTAMLFVSLPYLVNMSREAFALIDSEMEQVAAIDGASPWQAFWYVTLPQAWRGIAGGALMMWARGISEFGAVVILAYHPKVVTVLIFERFQGFGLSQVLPVTILLILVALLVFILLRWVLLPERKH
ncbi:MAG: ABC transporter permease [Chloroflexota bacterium]|jgi:molybdate/tungstate transport system permease protein